MGDESEWMKLPTDQKVEHKAWKARVAGYEEVTKAFATAGDEKAPIFGNYQGVLRKFVTDSNAIAQEKALDAVIAYMENASSNMIGRVAADVCCGMVTKCLNASRTKTKEKTFEIFMLIIEAEKHEFVQEELIKGLSNKQPKIVCGSVITLKEAMAAFGPKVISAKPLMKLTPKLLEDRDKNVRDETKQLIVQIYRWIGPAIKPQMASLKPIQLTELETEFANLPGGTPKQTRFLRSQQDLKEKMEAAADAGEEEAEDEEGEADEAPVMDAYDMADPVNILAKLPADFYDKIEEKKWQERREVLEVAQKLSESIKLENGDYHDLVKVLKKVVAKDSNVMLVAIAAKTLSGLAAGLRKKFATHALGVADVCLEKFKEKKVNVVEALKQCIDATFLTTTLDVLGESCVAALNHKTPTVKAQTADFLARCFCRSTPATLPKKLLKMFVAPLLKTINDTTPDVREASFKALGTAMKVVGEKHLQPFLADVDPLKLVKIKECCDSAELIGKSGKPKAAAAAAAAAPKKAAPVAKPAAKSAAGSAKPAAAKKVVTGGGGKKKAAGAKGKKGGAKDDGPSENFLSDEAVEEKAAAALPSDCIAGLANAVWKERLAAMEKFTEVVKGMSRDDIPCQAFVRTIAKKPGLKETNFQVMKVKVELIALLAKNSKFTRTSAECCLNDLVDKVGDVKNGHAVQEALSCIAEAVGLEFVSLQVTNYAFEQKNPKNQSESLNWLAQAIKEFGFKVNVKPMLGSIKKALAHTNPAVRTAGITLIGVLHMYMGATARVFFEDEKPALLQQIDAEIEKNAGSKPAAPMRGHTAGGEAAEDDDEDEDADEDNDEGGVNVADLVPRNDISDKITDTVVAELADTQWKVRAKALQDVATILNEAKFITPNIGELATALNTRLKKDSNKILVTTTLNICTTLATAMGPNIKRHVQTLGPGILGCCGDAKPALRAAAVNTLNTWVEQAKLHPFIDNEILSDALKMENPNLRTELFGWLAEKLPDMKKLPAELKDSLPYLYAGLEDRNAGVRQKAADAVLSFMIQLRYEPMLKAAQKIKAPKSKELVMAALEKAKPNLPAKPVKQKAASAAPTAVAMDDDEPEEPEEEAEKPKAAAKAPAKGKAGGKTKPGAKKPAAASSKKKVEEEETGPPLKANKAKDQRIKDEKQLKVLKWNFKTPIPEFKEQLKLQMEPNLSKTLYDNMWHADFKKHIAAIEILDREVTNSSDAVMSQLDLILKWMTIRFFDTNTSVLLKGLEFLQNLFNLLAEEDYHLLDLEASSFVPYLVTKVGDPKDNVRKSIRALFKSICKVYPASKMFSFLLEGLKSKNTKERAECLEELGLLIDFYGINVCHPSPAQALKTIAGQICHRDNPVRTAALNTLVVAYNILGETVYKYVGRLNDKDMGMLEERIKRSGKLRPDSAPAGGGGGGGGSDRRSPEEKPKVARVQPNQNRPQTGGGKPMGIARPRQVRREFNLDFDDNEDNDGENVPQLVQHDNLEELLNEPIAIPETRVRTASPSSSGRTLTSTSDTKSAIDLVISQVASTDVLTTIQALAQIDEVMKDSEKCELLGEHVDQLLVMCSMKLRMTRGLHVNYADNEAVEEALQCYRSLLATIISIFQAKSLSKRPTLDVCKDLFLNLFSVLLDSRLEDIEDGLHVIRSVNVTVVKIVDKGEPTCVMGALLKLLQETVTSETSSAKLLELIMKCLWKQCRGLPNFINDLDMDRALMHVHHFMKAHPSSSWAAKSSDMPLRTVKTIVHTLAKLKGAKIMSHLTLIDQSNSELEAYLRKVLKNTGVDLSSINAQNEQLNGSPGRASNGVALRNARLDSNKSNSKRLSKSTHDMLAEIFKKIGSKENTREGLNDLFDFKIKYPDADLEPFLKKSSQFFQNYIERGLKNIAIEREEKGKTINEPTIPHSKSAGSLSTAGSGSLTGSSGDDVNTNVYLERLKVLRARCGLDNQAPGAPPRPLSTGNLLTGAGDLFESNSSISSSSSTDAPQLQLGASISKSSSKDDTSENAQQPSAANVADLKKRLERIKMAARK